MRPALTLRRIAIALLALLLLAYLALCAWLYSHQRSLLYFPQPLPPGAEAEVVLLRDSGPRVLVTTREVEGDDAMVYFGGNGEVVANRLPEFAAAFPKHALYFLHYRGYAGSAGEPTEAGLYADALALYDKVHKQHARVIVVGRSLGSGLAVRVASERTVARLVLVTPYDSIVGIAAEQYPLFPVSMLMRDRYESFLYAPKVRAPTRLIVAGADQVIPRHSSDLLLSRFRPGLAKRTVIEGAGHNDVSQDPRYLPLFTAP
ncbi:MAG: alpha/beta hydrolase [Arenimonas sp.]